jgi:hypothetical protein
VRQFAAGLGDVDDYATLFENFALECIRLFGCHDCEASPENLVESLTCRHNRIGAQMARQLSRGASLDHKRGSV